jgi:hypothetical protein
MNNTFIILLVLFAMVSMGATLMLPQANVGEGFKNPTETYDSKKPHNLGPGGTQQLMGGCAGTRYGCCPDGTTAKKYKNDPGCLKQLRNLGPGGIQRLMGGCAGTRYGCCPDGTTAKKNENDKCGSQKPHPHRKHGHGRRVPDNMHHSRYKKFVPSDLDEMPVTKEMYEEIGKDFMRDEASLKGKSLPYIHDHEAEVLGRMVWRVYVAEMQQKLANSPKAADEVMQREIQLLEKVSHIMKSETDHHKGKKHQSIASQASNIPGCNPLGIPSRRTTNQFGYRPPSNHNIKRETGHAFEGRPIHGSPRYYDITNAIEHCFNDRACGGVNFDTTSGEYTLMPVHARLIKRSHYTALIKRRHHRPNNPRSENKHKKNHHHGHHEHGQRSSNENPYVPITGIGYSGNQSCKGGNPLDPNTLPRPYNSIMDLFS